MKPKYLISFVAVALTAFAVAANTALATSAKVTVRVEGPASTIYEGAVTTEGHTVTTESGGTHKCNGTNDGVYPEPVPVATAALDTAAKADGFTWNGPWVSSFEDYDVTRIANTIQTETEFWELLVNYLPAERGGCEVRVASGNEVLWAFNGFNAEHFLKLTGPKTAKTDTPITVKVTDGATGEAISDALIAPVNGSEVATNPKGEAMITFTTTGEKHIKASKAKSIRSATLSIVVSKG
jgi:hypothetical protein